LPQIVTTDFNLTVQADGFAVNPLAWDRRFWEYDYIGATWPWKWGGGPYWRGPIVGNGGFSLRSRKLYDALLDLKPKWQLRDWQGDGRLDLADYFTYSGEQKVLPEDALICCWYGGVLETRYGIRFCPPELANKFSVEDINPYTQYWLGRSFGFHGPAAAPYYGIDL
jgi:hypothetical protein